jgi:hypothetical protein
MVEYETGVHVDGYSLQDNYNHHRSVTLYVYTVREEQCGLHLWPFYVHSVTEY